MDKSTPSFWRDVKPGSTITLSDAQALEDSMERGEGVEPRDYTIESVWKIRESAGLAEWILFQLDDEEQELYLVVKIVDQDLDLFVFYEPEEFEPGNRADIVERGDTWLFEEPEDVENFTLEELNFVSELSFTFEFEEEEGSAEMSAVHYKMKEQGVLYGECTREPAMSGLERVMACVVEYNSLEDQHNPGVFVLELGGEHSNEGGLISMMMGARINLVEVDVLKSQVEKPVERHKPSLWEKVLKKVGS